MKKLLVTVLIVLGVSGAYFALYQQASSELRLAELKSDLDGMYRPLERLAHLHAPSAKSRLERISHAIEIREEMLRAAADHDHEKAVIAAGRLLEIVPKHTDGIRTLRESGQIFYLLRQSLYKVTASLVSKEPTQATFEAVSFEVAGTPGEKNEKLVRYIQQGLTELGHYHDAVDGKAGSGTTDALVEFQKSTEASGKLTISDNTANEIAKALALKKAVKEWKEKKFFEVNRARELAQAAVDLDPRFERARRLADDLDQAHEAIALLLSTNVIKQGQLIIGMAASIHDSAASALADAATSRYGSVSVTYAIMEPILDKIRRLLGSMQEDVDESMRLIGTYKGNRSKEYLAELKEFSQVVRTGTDALLVPTGNLMQFRQAANDTVQEFKRIQSRIETFVPNSAEIEESIAGLTKIFSEYPIFDYQETEKVIDAHIDLYRI